MGDSSPPQGSTAATASGTHLQGNLGTIGLLFMTLAFQAPLISVAAFLPFVLGGGLGAAFPVGSVFVIAVMLLFSVGLVAMAKRMEKPGGLYTYISVGLGRATGLGGGFLALASYLLLGINNAIVSGIAVSALLEGTLGLDAPWWACTLGLWALVSVLTLFNIDVSGKVLGVALCLEVVIVLVWDAVVLINGGPEGRGLDIPAYFSVGKLGFALLWGMAGFIGFEAIQVFRSESRDPDRTVPRATYLTVIVLGLFYALASWAYLVSYGTDAAMATATDPINGFLGSLEQYVGVVVRDLATVLLSTSGIALVLASQNISARYVFTLAEDRVFPHALSAVHPKHHAPSRAAATVAGIALIGILVPMVFQLDPTFYYTTLAGMSLWGLLLLLTVAGLAIIVFFRRNRGLETNPWKSLVAPVVGTLGLATVVVLATLARADLFGGEAGLGTICILALIAVGVAGAAYALWLRAKRPQVYSLIDDPAEHAPAEPGTSQLEADPV
jgi:amino acid transporter